MKAPIVLITSLLILIYSCKKQQVNAPALSFNPKVVETHGYVVPKDSLAEPKIFQAGNPRVVIAGEPKIIPINTNVYVAGSPRMFLAGLPRICIPGQDSFSIPKIIAAKGKVRIPGAPEVILAKDAVVKDQNSFNFRSFGILQGLNNPGIFSLLEDKSGNLWIGTYGGGVSKYDGVSFTHLTEKEGLGHNNVVSIIEDKRGNLWFGTLGGGVCKYDGYTFTQFTDKDGLGSNFIHCLIEDKKGNIWIGTAGGGVTKYDPRDRPLSLSGPGDNQQDSTPVFTRITEKEGFISNYVWTIMEDKNGSLWFGTNRGVCKYDGSSFTHYSNKEGLIGTNFKAILEDQNGNFWFGGWASGVYKFDGKYFTHFTVNEGLSHNNVKTILENKNGNLWIGTEGGGINLYKSGKGDSTLKQSASGNKFVAAVNPATFTQFTVREGLSSDFVQSLCITSDGILWIGTNNNLNRFGGNAFTYYTEKEGITGTIKSILETKNGNIWLGGTNGLSRFDGKSFLQYTEKEGMIQDNVNTLLEDRNGNLWMGSYVGVTRYGGKSFAHFTTREGLGIGGNIHSIVEDHNGNLWFGLFNGGVSKFDGKSFTHLTTKEGLNSNWVWTILEDKMNNLWITSADKGISKYNPDSKNGPFTLFPELENIGITTVNSVLEDQKGNIWFGTGGGGVISYRPVGSLDTSFDPNSTNVKFTHYTKNEGLISNNIVDILEDNDNDLWFSSSDGISKLNKNYSQEWTNQNKYQDKLPSNFKSPTLFKNYTYSDGYPGSGRTNTIDKNGTIWIGSNSRLTAFHPGLEIPDTIPPNIQLANLALFNENIYWPLLQSKIDTSFVLGNGERIHDLQFEEVNKWYGIPQGLSLAYDNNHLNFRYVGITTHSPKKVSYQYKLEGLDHNWSALTDRTEISYNNLSHGAYNFKLKAMNSEGYWSRELNYTFRIRPPWWLSTEAYIFYGLSLITGLFFTDRIQRKRVLEKERAKTREREYEQAKEIEKAYIILKDTQAQLIQSEKMASLGELTAGIAHEIQNPLNFVNNFSEVNSELIDELQSELKQGNTNEALCLSNGIKENESKINLHGKRAESIVKSMLQHSQKSSGVKEPTDINVLAEEYMRLSYHGLRAKDKSFQAELKMNLDPTLPLVNIIPQDIGRVLLNLFNNAFWACAERSLSAEMEEGNKKSEQDLEGLDTGKQVRNLPGLVPTYTPIVTLTTHNLNDKIEIRIRDNGPGIPPHVIEKIFQPFFTTKPTGQGTGLGLSLAYDIVKAHTGSISVKSEEGEGTEFDIILPVG